MPYLASFFNAMFGVKKLAGFHIGDGLLVSIVPMLCNRLLSFVSLTVLIGILSSLS